MPQPLERIIRASWSLDTTSLPDEWDELSAPERGQCVPTALIVQDCLGGTLERLATDYQGKQETHYRNIIDGTTIDLTRNQYPEDQVFTPAPVEGDLRTYVLGNEQTTRRYKALAARVIEAIELGL
ncbi:MAG TPA: hypothetical protein PKV96_03910 [Candidatus Saccharimonas sp.]|jgi:hypothetical protein|nr:hypothetical protein [Candidatus Saccharimonas sp.]